MILHFINIKNPKLGYIFFVLVGFFFSYDAFSDQKNVFRIPNSTNQIYWICDHYLCDTYLKTKNNKTVIIAKKNQPPSISVLNNNLIGLFFSCGSPCNHTIFYDKSEGLSRSFEFVIAIDSKQKIVLSATKNRILAYKIFDKSKDQLFTIKRDWSPTATLFSDIIEAKFIKNGIYIKYLKGNNFDETNEVIPFHQTKLKL